MTKRAEEKALTPNALWNATQDGTLPWEDSPADADASNNRVSVDIDGRR